MDANGVRLWFGASHACAVTREPEIVVEGEMGRAVWRHERECVVEVDGHRTFERPLPPTSETRRSMLRAVVGNVRIPGTFVCGPEIAIRHTALIEAAHRGTRILEAPGTAVLRQIPSLAEPVLCSPDIESKLLQSFDAASLPGTP